VATNERWSQPTMFETAFLNGGEQLLAAGDVLPPSISASVHGFPYLRVSLTLDMGGIHTTNHDCVKLADSEGQVHIWGITELLGAEYWESVTPDYKPVPTFTHKWGAPLPPSQLLVLLLLLLPIFFPSPPSCRTTFEMPVVLDGRSTDSLTLDASMRQAARLLDIQHGLVA